MKFNFTKILILGLIIISIFVTIIVGVVSAKWPLPKYPTCEMLNVTQYDCDRIWCGVLDCDFDESKTACICGGFLDNNTTMNETWLEDFVLKILNQTNMTDFLENYNFTGNKTYYTKQEIDNITITLRNNILNNQENRTEELVKANIPKNLKNSGSSGEPLSPWIIVFVVFAFCCLVGFLAWTGMQNKKVIKARPKVVYKGMNDNESNENFKDIEPKQVIKELSKIEGESA